MTGLLSIRVICHHHRLEEKKKKNLYPSPWQAFGWHHPSPNDKRLVGTRMQEDFISPTDGWEVVLNGTG